MFSSKELKKANEQFLQYVDQNSKTTANKIVNKGEAFDATKTVQEFTNNIQSCWLSQYIGKTININQTATEQDGYLVLRCKVLDLKPLVSTIGKHTVTGSFSKLVGNALNSPELNNVDLFKKETKRDAEIFLKALKTKKTELVKINKTLFDNYLKKEKGIIRKILKIDSKLQVQRLKAAVAAYVCALINCMTILLDVIIKNVKIQESELAEAKKAASAAVAKAWAANAEHPFHNATSRQKTAPTADAKAAPHATTPGQAAKTGHTWHKATTLKQKVKTQVTIGKRPVSQ